MPQGPEMLRAGAEEEGLALRCPSPGDLDLSDFLARWGTERLDCVQERVGSEEGLSRDDRAFRQFLYGKKQRNGAVAHRGGGVKDNLVRRLCGSIGASSLRWGQEMALRARWRG